MALNKIICKGRLIGPNRHQPKKSPAPTVGATFMVARGWGVLIWRWRGMRDNPVMLSAAKHLAAARDRPFAALRVCPERSEWGDTVWHFRLMPIRAGL